MIDLGRQGDLTRLYEAINHSREAMRPFRRSRLEMLDEFVGAHYSDGGANQEVLVNLLNMTAEVYTHGLAANNPRVRISTEHRSLWPFAYRWRQSLNNLIKEMRFAGTLQKIVLDAFFTCGVAKVFQASTQRVQLEDDVWADPGRPYIGRVSFDDFGMDMTAKDIRRCRFMFDEYRVSWQSVKDDPDFDQSVVKELSPTSKSDRDVAQAADISAGLLVDDDEYEPMTDLMDVWLPELEKVAIFPRYVQKRPLKVVDAGPEGGPYHFLSFADVPDNVMPTTPAQNLMGLHELYNSLARKQADQARRQKTITAYTPAGTDDAERIREANDGDLVKISDPSAINVIQMGGVDAANVAFGIGVLDLFDRQAGNLSAMAGLGPQAGTLGQEELIHRAVSRKEASMQQRVHSFTSDLIRSLAHLMWADVTLEVPAEIDVYPGTGVRLPASWTPEKREGDFVEYNFEVEPYSMTYESPEAKIQKMERAMDRLQLMFPIIQAAGGNIDIQQMQRDIAEMYSIPELKNWITFSNPPAIEGPGPAGGGPSMPAATTRSYVRRNVATGGTPQNQSAQLQESWMGGVQGGQGAPQQMGAG